jgi:membrane protein YqaA with SNARE-associated domain
LPPGNRRAYSFAAIWGFAEAVVFFTVPDVLLTFLAQTSLRRALLASLFTAAAACTGGALLYTFALARPDAANALLLAVPGIFPDLITRAGALLENGLLPGLVEGSLTGVPYKIFAVEAAQTGTPLALFLLASLPARLLRFTLSCLASWLIFAKLLSGVSLWTRRILLAAFWIVFYVAYYAGLE